MSLQFEINELSYDTYAPFTDRLSAIYTLMDQKYAEAAEYYGFYCTGCRDNCCLTRFYHHTLLEYFYLLAGYNMLDNEKRVKAKNRASRVCKKFIEADEKGITDRLMCPLNFNSLCILYAHRPMICRLHGIPHELHRPGRRVLFGPGCHVFTENYKNKNYFKFDRTPFYIELAELEKELRQAVGMMQKIKMTVAEMVSNFYQQPTNQIEA